MCYDRRVNIYHSQKGFRINRFGFWRKKFTFSFGEKDLVAFLSLKWEPHACIFILSAFVKNWFTFTFIICLKLIYNNNCHKPAFHILTFSHWLLLLKLIKMLEICLPGLFSQARKTEVEDVCTFKNLFTHRTLLNHSHKKCFNISK